MSLNVPAFAEEKNRTFGDAFIILLEIEYSEGEFLRLAQYDTAIEFEGHTWDPFPIAGVNITQSSRGDIPAFDIGLSNVGRSIQSILEYYEVEGAEGRILWVHPDMLLDDTAKIEESFVVVSANANNALATLTVAPVKFDPFGVELPVETVTTSKFPGVLGTRARYLI